MTNKTKIMKVVMVENVLGAKDIVGIEAGVVCKTDVVVHIIRKTQQQRSMVNTSKALQYDHY